MSGMMSRNARDSYEALMTAQAMEMTGAQVISIAYDGEHQQQGALIPCSRFVVFAKVPGGVEINDIDEAIGRALFPDEYLEDETE